MFSIPASSHPRYSPARTLLASVLLVAATATPTTPPAQDGLDVDPDSSPTISSQISGGLIGNVPRGWIHNNPGTGSGLRLYFGVTLRPANSDC